uniref:Peptidase_S9_N domain-containing protein n=1 Tax=Parastrongyloides trichosuri TaxID=131310 RepID=A0A0N4Z1E0_PARTI
DRNGKLSVVESIEIKDMESKKIYYFFNEKKVYENTEILTPCGISEVYDIPPYIKIDGYELVEASENNKIKMINKIKSDETKYFFKLEERNIKDFYLGEKVLIRKMIYRNGQAEIKDDKVIEASNISVTGHEILEISYKSLFRSRSYKDVKEIIFFGPVEKETTLEKKTVEISAMDTSYQPSCSFSEFDYAYLYQMKTDNDEIKMESLATDGAVFRDFTRSGDLVKYKSGDVDKMDWVCIYKTPNGKILCERLVNKCIGHFYQELIESL